MDGEVDLLPFFLIAAALNSKETVILNLLLYLYKKSLQSFFIRKIVPMKVQRRKRPSFVLEGWYLNPQVRFSFMYSIFSFILDVCLLQDIS